MSNLFAALQSSAGALRTLETSVKVSQNNVQNASTPGYARQRVNLEALAFQPEAGLLGGIGSAGIQDLRSRYAEQMVQLQMEAVGSFSQQATNLESIEGVFDATGKTGIPAAMNELSESFSAWSLAPNSVPARETVLASARNLAENFQQAARRLTAATTASDAELKQTVAKINEIGAGLRDYNVERRRNPWPDAGLEARAFSMLESLSELVDTTALVHEDGAITVLVGGQTALVLGDQLLELKVEPVPAGAIHPDAPPAMRLADTDGRDVTAQISGGRLKGLLDFRNTVLPRLQGDGNQPGRLNELARKIAERMNEILEGGYSQLGPPPVSGIPLFIVPPSETAIAAAISVNPSITPMLLAAISAGPPPAANGNALRLAELATSRDAADQIDGRNIVDYYGSLASGIGRALSAAREGASRHRELAIRAKDLRSELSGVSLDEEAVRLVELQKAYQAIARTVSVVDELTETVLNLLR